jgi:hypothetical protein
MIPDRTVFEIRSVSLFGILDREINDFEQYFSCAIFFLIKDIANAR